jgi:hypothetical protein
MGRFLNTPSSGLSVGWLQIAVLKEVDARGPFSSLVMSVVVVKDVAVITCFALNIEVAKVVGP